MIILVFVSRFNLTYSVVNLKASVSDGVPAGGFFQAVHDGAAQFVFGEAFGDDDIDVIGVSFTKGGKQAVRQRKPVVTAAYGADDRGIIEIAAKKSSTFVGTDDLRSLSLRHFSGDDPFDLFEPFRFRKH